MPNQYQGVTTRFLRDDERLILSKEKEMPLVIEAKDSQDISFLQRFLKQHSAEILEDIAIYGAVLLRGFQVKSDADFENTVLSINGLQGIGDAFMSEQGRTHVNDDLKYVLHTNAVYKTGGTLYLGGFHSENYYSPDVPGYICFCCLKPSTLGGETGLINTEKLYEHLPDDLKQRLLRQSYFVSQWLVSEVVERYQMSVEKIEQICREYDLPIIGEGKNRFILMYKPSVFEDPVTKKQALQINYFELQTLNIEMRKCFNDDYQGREWFWHRFVWRLPKFIMRSLELTYITIASMLYSPRESLAIYKNKRLVKNAKVPPFDDTKVGSCFTDADVKNLAKLMREYYCSCLWQAGDIILVDNKKVVHAGMPGAGPRLIRAMICNPIEIPYSAKPAGAVAMQPRQRQTVVDSLFQ